MSASDTLTQARAAFQRRDWVAAYEGLSSARDDALRAADFADLATAAYLLERHDDCVAALQRAHQSYVRAGEVGAAVRTAFWLSLVLRQQGEFAVANGWIARAERLAPDLPDGSVEFGYLEYARMMREVFEERITADTERPAIVLDYGRRFNDPNLIAAGLMSSGRRAIYGGRVSEGLAFLDEAVVTMLNGGLSPIIAGQVLCSAIEGCQELWEFGRIVEWTRALDTWCEDQSGMIAYTGMCALHKGQVLAQHGDLAAAAAEFEAAVERFALRGNHRAQGVALTELADALRALGRLDTADDALRRAREAGWDPVSAQAMLDLALDRVDAAVAAATRMMAQSRSPLHRAQRLTRVVDVLLAAGEVSAAEPVVQELCDMAGRIDTAMFVAHAHRASGALSLARGDAGTAEAQFRMAITSFVAVGGHYEAARTRLLLAQALDDAGDPMGSERERCVALAALEQMGAVLGPSHGHAALTLRQLEVLRLVALGRSNREIAREMNLSEKTVARHLSNIFLKLGVPSRTAAVAYAFENRLVETKH